jgi:molybdenum cofactor cytidylyltransferase
MAEIGAVLLAAGASQRFGPPGKLLADIGGEALVRRVARVLVASGLRDIVAVTGGQQEACREALADLPVRIVFNAQWSSGMGSSIAAGVAELGEGLDGAFIVPADMPFLAPDVLRGMRAAFERAGHDKIVYAATAAGEQRNPVLWPSHHFAALAALTGPRGAKRLIEAHAGEAIAVPVDDWALSDIDTPADLDAARARLTRTVR